MPKVKAAAPPTWMVQDALDAGRKAMQQLVQKAADGHKNSRNWACITLCKQLRKILGLDELWVIKARVAKDQTAVPHVIVELWRYPDAAVDVLREVESRLADLAGWLKPEVKDRTVSSYVFWTRILRESYITGFASKSEY